MGWNQVRWTEAHQIASLMGLDEDALPAPGVTPEQHYATLREVGEPWVAIDFLGHALPRLEALSWSAKVLEQEAEAQQLKRADRQALDHALRWLGDPSDQNRRASFDAANAAGERSPERMLALGVFFSGGSISEPDLPPVLPKEGIAGRLAAGAITAAAFRNTDHLALFDRALALGEKVAADGLKALHPA